MLIYVFYQILLFIGDPILLGIFKFVEYILDPSGLGAVFIGHSTDGDFILDDRHEC